jgi:uncharacterized protein (TIGR03083 family)
MGYDRLCDEIVVQTRLLSSFLENRGEPADAQVALPSCPGWNVGQLLRHLGGVQRWAAELVRTRADGPVPDEYHGALIEYADEELAVLVPWVVEGASLLTETLCDAGPGVAVWTRCPTERATSTHAASRTRRCCTGPT